MEPDQSYIASGFNKFLRRGNSPVIPVPEVVTRDEKMEDEVSIKTPQMTSTIIIKEIQKEKVETAIGDLIRVTGIETASSGSVANNAGVRVTSTLTDNIDPNRIMFGICEVAAYQDSIAGTNVIPYGSDAIGNNHRIFAAYDLKANQADDHPGKAISYVFHIQNQTGSSHTYHFVVRWRYIGRESAT